MRFVGANRIHNGYGFLPPGSVLILDDKGVVADIKPAAEIEPGKIEFYRQTICPGFVNTHCHLELSWFKNRISEQKGLDEFIREVEEIKKNAGNTLSEEEKQQAISDADAEMVKNGIVAVGDICNTADSFAVKKKSLIHYHNFLEVYAFDPDRADAVFEKGLALAKKLVDCGLKHFSITPHAPYSASVKLLRKIADLAEENFSVLSIHMQENEDENALFLNKSGKILERLKKFGIDVSGFSATGKSSLQSSLIHLPRNRKILLVHNTFSNQADIDFAADYSKDIVYCFCPNANKFIEGKLPQLQLFADNNCTITLGTDSLASNWSLSVADEMSALFNGGQSKDLEAMLGWATINGAKFLGIEEKYGSFEKGKAPGIVALSSNNGKFTSEKI